MKSLLFVVFSAPALFGANLFTNPGFEQNAIGSTFVVLGSGDSTSLPGWLTTGTCGGNCLLVLRDDYTEPSNAGTISFQPNGGTQSVDLTGSGNTLTGGLQQTVTLTPGLLYTLSFWLANMDNRASNYTLPSAAEVFINDVSQGTFTNAGTTNGFYTWAPFAFNFTASAASTTIRFSNATGLADNAAGLDDVFLDVASTDVPEPGTAGMLAIACAAAAVALRRRC
jgi:hypothetical protein